MHSILKTQTLYYLILTISALILLAVLLLIFIYISPPKESETEITTSNRLTTGKDIYKIGRNWLRKNDLGLQELYIEGAPYERGVVAGKLTAELIHRQEKIFIDEIFKIIPSKYYIYFLRVVIALLNRRLHKFIGDEYCREILGISRSAPDEFAFVGPRYQRMLNYHAAHDIGHTLQNMHLVGCTSFSAWGNFSKDGCIITGRNFDFHINDDFSKEKIIAFISPDKGYKYAAITWGGMIGTASGMNEHGLAVMVNGARSVFPGRSATPVSILIKEILQYAKNINEAFKIASSRRIFVSEILVVSSAIDKKTVLIEKSGKKTVLFQNDKDYIICSNHFQSPELFNDKLNQRTLVENPTLIRYKRVEEMMLRHAPISENDAAILLRDKKGLHDTELGLGNEIATDQLIAHHSVIFKPEKKLLWICTGPYSEGKYHAYNIDKIFNDPENACVKSEIFDDENTIAADDFYYSPELHNFEQYKKLIKDFSLDLVASSNVSETVDRLISCNPYNFNTYSVLGDYFLKKKNYETASAYFKKGLEMQIPNYSERKHMEKEMAKCNKKIKLS